MEKVLNVAIVGGSVKSAVGLVHRIAICMDNKFKIAAGVFSKNQDINKQTALYYGVDNIYNNYIDMLKMEKGNVDVVVVLTPTDTHKTIVVEALNFGYHVICEKALATSSVDAEIIINQAKAKGLYLGVTYNYTGYPMIRVLREKILNNELGKITHIAIKMPQEGFARYGLNGDIPKPQEWRLKDYEIPTISLDLGVHLHNMISFLVNATPLQITSKESNYGFYRGIVDNVYSIVEYSDDISVQMWYSKTSLGYRNGLEIEIFGNFASAKWYQMEPEILYIHKNDGQIIIDDRSRYSIGFDNLNNRFKPGHPIGFVEAFANYYNELHNDICSFIGKDGDSSEYIIPIEKTIEGLKMFEFSHQSALDNTWKKIIL